MNVLLLDIDPQSNTTLWVMDELEFKNHILSRTTIKTLFEHWIACGSIMDIESMIINKPLCKRKYRDASIAFVPSHIELFGIDDVLAPRYDDKRKSHLSILDAALERIRNTYDLVFIDCPPNMNLVTQNAIIASDAYVIVTEPNYLSTVGIAQIQRCVERVIAKGPRMNGTETRECVCLGIVVNKQRYLNRGTFDQNQIMRKLDREYGELTFKTHIPLSQRIARSAEDRIPIVLSPYSVDRLYRERFENLADELLDRLTYPTNGFGGNR